MAIQYDYVWKVVVAGDGGVGKTTIIHRYITDEFLDSLKMTIGCDFHFQSIERSGRSVSLVLWDLGGQDHFRFFQDDYMKGASGAFLCFDMNMQSTLENCREWVQMLDKNAPGAPVVLVGTKMDLLDGEADVSRVNELADEMVKEMGLLAYVPTSAKLGINVSETVLYLADILLYRLYTQESGH